MSGSGGVGALKIATCLGDTSERIEARSGNTDDVHVRVT